MIRSIALSAMLLLLWPPATSAGDKPAVSARSRLDLADEAARSWASDAFLIYVENDEPISAAGQAERWGFLYYSPTKDRSRAYSIDAEEIEVATDLDFTLEAPPVAEGWVDSGQAMAAAEKDGGRKYREEFGGALKSMLLIRGAFHQNNPDRTTWTLVYGAPDAPSYFVVVDAHSGKVVRQWKG